MNLRSWVLDPIKEHLPESWRFVPYLEDSTAIHDVTVMLQLDTIEQSDDMAASHWRVEYDLFVILPPDPDGEAANDQIDDALLDLLMAVHENDRILIGKAERGVTESYLFYRVPLTAVIKKVQD